MTIAIDKTEEYQRRWTEFWEAEEKRLERDRKAAAGGIRYTSAVKWFEDRKRERT